MKADLVIKNGVVCTPDGLLRVGIAVEGGKIIAVAPETVLPEAEKIIDAAGKVVIPGLIDAHVHTRDPGYTHKEDFETATRCAAFGGITMIVDMPNVKPPPISVETYEEKRRICKAKAIVDFNHWASPFRVKEIPGIAELGAVGFKAFMKEAAYPYDTEASSADQGLLYEAFKTIAKTGLPCIVHAHNQDIYEYIIKNLKEAERSDFQTFWWKTTSPEVMESVVPLLIYLAERAGMKLGLLHTNTKRQFEFVKEARKRGQEVFAERNPWGIWPPEKGSPAYGRFPATFQSDIPPERVDEFVRMAWENLLSEDFLKYGYIATDHAPHLEEECFVKDPAKSNAGHGDTLDFYLSRFLTEVNRNKISLQRMVKLCSENVAKFLGVYPRKGTVQIGADADLTIIDMKKKYTVTKEVIHSKCGWSLWEGAELEGAPVYTIVRGKVVMEGGKVVGTPGYGEFVKPVQGK